MVNDGNVNLVKPYTFDIPARLELRLKRAYGLINEADTKSNKAQFGAMLANWDDYIHRAAEWKPYTNDDK
jgi:hypothetical protein